MRTFLALPLVLLLACLALAPAAGAQTDPIGPEEDPFAGNGMWIWQVPKAEGGDPAAIAERAHAANIDTLFIKGAHGPDYWPQFSATFVAALKGQGLNVCAYQRLLGTRPTAEAAAAEKAVDAGADCFVIDAEAELEGKYRQARVYMKSLRKRIGADFPLGYTSFPYVSLHPLEPYSVFLGEGGATVNMPQIYWKAIGHRPSASFARTVADNSVYGRPLAPIGQLYEGPPRSDILAFRRLALAHDTLGISWWSWDSARPSGWAALRPFVRPAALTATTPTYPVVRPGARSDYVVFAKDHLRKRGYRVSRHTRFDAATRAVVQAFQRDSGLPVTGVLDAATWTALLDAADD